MPSLLLNFLNNKFLNLAIDFLSYCVRTLTIEGTKCRLCDQVGYPFGFSSKLTKITTILFKHKEKIYESAHSSRFWIV